ncbi:MAG: DUF302 domain-containing protein [Gammaproteobacteria bacterium]|jgi:uncharacterized protein (DUF302 family)
MLSLIKNLFATLGVVFLLILLVLYARGWSVTHELEPEAAAALEKFATHALTSDLATAGIFKIPLEGSVNLQQAIKAMKREATRHELKLVAEGVPSNKRPKLAILNFCDVKTRDRLFAFNPALIPYMPCRITLYEDQEGIVWASAVNLDVLLNTTRSRHPEAREPIAALKDALVAVIKAGANGKPLD